MLDEVSCSADNVHLGYRFQDPPTEDRTEARTRYLVYSGSIFFVPEAQMSERDKALYGFPVVLNNQHVH